MPTIIKLTNEPLDDLSVYPTIAITKHDKQKTNNIVKIMAPDPYVIFSDSEFDML